MGTTEFELPPGALVDRRYQIQHVLGRGGFGRTYLAVDQCRFGEFCVLKEFAPTSQSDPIVTQKLQDLFQREANILHQLNHPQIPQFFSVFQSEGRSFIAQEYINGKTYWSLLRDRHYQGESFSELEIVQWLWDLLQVLDYLHQRNIIHRDISPDNIMQAQGRPLPILIDFGAVKQAAYWIQATQTTDWMQTSVSVGKSGYAPIEQLQMGHCSPASDLYALAVTAVVLLTCKTPNQLINPTSLEWHWQSLVNLPPALISILETMMAEKPQVRYTSAPDVLSALRSLYPTLATQRLVPAIALHPESEPVTDWLAVQSVPPLWNNSSRHNPSHPPQPATPVHPVAATPATPVAQPYPAIEPVQSTPLHPIPLNPVPLVSIPQTVAINASTVTSTTPNPNLLNSNPLPDTVNPATFVSANDATHFNPNVLRLSAIATESFVQNPAQNSAQHLILETAQTSSPANQSGLPEPNLPEPNLPKPGLNEPAIASTAKSFYTLATQLSFTELKHLVQQLLPQNRFRSALLLSLVTLLPISGLALGIASPRIALLCQTLNNCTGDLKAEADFRSLLGQANAAQMSADQARRIEDLQSARERLLIVVNELTDLASKVTHMAMAEKLVMQYRNSLQAIEARLESELQARDLLEQSTAAASLALDQTRAAQTSQDYLLAQLSWNRALSLLQSISSQSWLAEQARWRSQDYAIRIDAINIKLGRKPQFFPELATSNVSDLLLAQPIAQPETPAVAVPSTAPNTVLNQTPHLQPSLATAVPTAAIARSSRFATNSRSTSIDTTRYPHLAVRPPQPPATPSRPSASDATVSTWAENLRRNYLSTSLMPSLAALPTSASPLPAPSPSSTTGASAVASQPLSSALSPVAASPSATIATAPVDRRRSAFPRNRTGNRSTTSRSYPLDRSTPARPTATPAPATTALPALPATTTTAALPVTPTDPPATATPKSRYSQSTRNIILDAAQTLDDVSVSLGSARLSHGTLVANLVIENRSDRTFGFVPLFAEIQDTTGRTLQSRIMLDNAESAMIAPGGNLQAQVYLFNHDWSGSGSQNVALVIKEGTTGQRNFRLAF